MMMYYDHGMYMLEINELYSAVIVEIFIYMHDDFGSLRRNFYFLNICYIHAFYRFNRSRALHVGIRAWLVLVRTSIR
jgi:hypothetical protein